MVIIDHWGIIKADIGIHKGRIVAIGKAGNPEIQNNIDIIVGPNTRYITGRGLLATAGAIDTDYRFTSRRHCLRSLLSGVTTMIGGDLGPAAITQTGSAASSPERLRQLLRSTDTLPANIGLLGKGSRNADRVSELLETGAMGLQTHEDWGATPEVIDTCLSIAEKLRIPVSLWGISRFVKKRNEAERSEK